MGKLIVGNAESDNKPPAQWSGVRTGQDFEDAIENATPAASFVDGSTLEVSSGAVRIKDGGVVEAKLGAGSVAHDKLKSGLFDDSTIHIDSGVVKVKDGGIVEAKLGDGAVTADKIGSGAVVTAGIGDLQVTAGKLAGSIPMSKMLTCPVELSGGGFNNLPNAKWGVNYGTVIYDQGSKTQSYTTILTNNTFRSIYNGGTFMLYAMSLLLNFRGTASVTLGMSVAGIGTMVGTAWAGGLRYVLGTSSTGYLHVVHTCIVYHSVAGGLFVPAIECSAANVVDIVNNGTLNRFSCVALY